MEKELLLLGILRRQDMYGYQLAEFIEHNLGTCTDLTKPMAYYLLDKMAQAGWITAEQTQPGKRPARRVYHLTGEGEATFQHLLRQSLASYTPQVFSGFLQQYRFIRARGPRCTCKPPDPSLCNLPRAGIRLPAFSCSWNPPGSPGAHSRSA